MIPPALRNQEEGHPERASIPAYQKGNPMMVYRKSENCIEEKANIG
jgi:hypothetical protein